MPAPTRVVFVCSGNICRSPTAEVVLTRLAEDTGRSGLVTVASAGTGGWHAGEDMDRRSRSTLAAAGYEWPRHTARQFVAADFDRFDVVVALDSGHDAELRELARHSDDPAAARDTIVLLRTFDPELGSDEPDVADPYYGGASGFTDVLAQVERSCAALLDAIEAGTIGQQTDKPPL